MEFCNAYKLYRRVKYKQNFSIEENCSERVILLYKFEKSKCREIRLKAYYRTVKTGTDKLSNFSFERHFNI